MWLGKKFSRCVYLLKNLDLQIIKCGMNYKLGLLESFSTFYACNCILRLHILRNFSPSKLESAKE